MTGNITILLSMKVDYISANVINIDISEVNFTTRTTVTVNHKQIYMRFILPSHLHVINYIINGDNGGRYERLY